MKIFILEDNFERVKCFKRWLSVKHTLHITDNVEDAKKLYEEHEPFDVYFLDHDLGGEVYVDSNEPNTGYQFAKYLAEKKASGKFITHSLNFSGAEAIISVLDGCVHTPFTMLYEMNK